MADLDRLLEAQSLGGEPLFLAMSGLTAARIGVGSALTQAPDALATRLAEGELARVRAIWTGRGLPVSEDKRLDYHLAAVATLCEGLPEEATHASIERECAALHLPAAQGTEPIRAALHTAWPAEGGGIAPILPDILGEAAMIVAWGKGPQGVEAVRRAPAERREAAMRVLVRTCQDFSVRGHRAPLRWLRAWREGATAEELKRLSDALPAQATGLAEFALQVERAIAGGISPMVRLGSGSGALMAAGVWHSKLASRLAALGQYQEAVMESAEALAVRRHLASSRSGGKSPQLAWSQLTHSSHLRKIGSHSEALEVGKAAEKMARHLAKSGSVSTVCLHAQSLDNLSLCWIGVGAIGAAVAAGTRAEKMARRLAKADPSRYRFVHAHSLLTVATVLAEAGERNAALEVAGKAVEIYRGPAMASPDTHGPHLSYSLTLLGFIQSPEDPTSSAASFAEAIRVGSAPSMMLPEAWAPQMRGMVNSYLDACAAVGHEPDMRLLSPIIDALGGYGGGAAP
jgi:tetratricopeptide (TPR) repeat protein